MIQHKFTKNGFTFERISKKTAKTAYKNGLTVVFSPVNLKPFNNFYSLDVDINKNNLNCNGLEFEKVVNAYENYNCNSETGLYTAFYIPIHFVDFLGNETASTTRGSRKEYNYKYLEV